MGGIIGNIVDIRPSRLRVRGLQPRELDQIRTIMGRVFNMYGLKLAGVAKEALRAEATHPEAKTGFLQREFRYPITLLHGISAAAVAADGLGSGKNDVNKRRVDRSASGVHGVGLNVIFSYREPASRVVFTAAAEGERVKPGEKGGNPATFRGQVSGAEDLRINFAGILKGEFERDIQVVNRVSDDVDGTGKATEGIHSSVTASVYTQSAALPLPDEYMNKVVSSVRLPDNITVQTNAGELVAALARAHGVPKSRLNLFSLIRPRHEEPINEIANLGPNFVQDKDGDIMPAIAAALGDYIFPNGYPYHGIAANVGGAAEAGLLLPVVWRGGSVLLEFASKQGLKSNRWQDRHSFSPEELATITEFGFEAKTPFPIEALFENPFADGIAVFGAITDNLYVEAFGPANRGLLGVEFGIEGVRAHALEISSNGRAEILHATYQYAEDQQTARAKLTPFITILLGAPDKAAVKDLVAQFVADNPMRLKTEFGHEYYLVLDVVEDRYRIDQDTYRALRKSGKTQRYTAADDAIIAEIKKQQPEWFVS